MHAPTDIRNAPDPTRRAPTSRLPEPPAQPRRRRTCSPERAGVKDSPPPEVADDSPRDADGSGAGAAHEEVHADEHVGKVDDGEGDEPEEGCLGPRWGEPGGDVGERQEERAGVHEGAEGDIETLVRNSSMRITVVR